MMKFLFTTIFLTYSVILFSQADSTKVYKTTTLKETFLLSTGAATLGLGYHLEKKTKPLSEDQIHNLSIYSVNRFDRSATHQHNEFAKKSSEILLLASFSAPLLLMTNSKIRQEKFNIGLMSLEVLCLSYGITSVIKTNVNRTRPLAYNPAVDLHEKQEVDTRFSFLSGHTSATAGLCFYSAKVFHDMSTNKKAKFLVWSLASMYPAITGYCRYKAGEHFPTDIISGYVLGALIGIGIPELHKIKSNVQFSPIITSHQKGFLVHYKF